MLYLCFCFAFSLFKKKTMINLRAVHNHVHVVRLNRTPMFLCPLNFYL